MKPQKKKRDSLLPVLIMRKGSEDPPCLVKNEQLPGKRVSGKDRGSLPKRRKRREAIVLIQRAGELVS